VDGHDKKTFPGALSRTGVPTFKFVSAPLCTNKFDIITPAIKATLQAKEKMPEYLYVDFNNV